MCLTILTSSKTPFKNIVGKGKNAGFPAFSTFPKKVFSQENSKFFVTFISVSANALNFDQYKLSFPKDRIFRHAILNISIVLRETTLTTSDSVETGSPVEIKIVRVVSLSAMKITKIL